jgi:hypothetical protein
VVVTTAKAISSAVDIPTAANAILTPLGIENLPQLRLRRFGAKRLISIAFRHYPG